jgi:DNA-binding transcriptional MerR regulator
VAERPYLRSGEVAQLTGVSPDTLRHYERLKLIAAPRRSDGNYRMYAADTVDRVRLIRRALAVGFSLSELARILKVRDANGAPCRQARRLLEEKLTQVERQITDLAAMRDHLRLVLKDWDDRLSATPDGKQARLLETLTKEQSNDKTFRTRTLGGRNHRL